MAHGETETTRPDEIPLATALLARVEEYKAIYNDSSAFSTRRQTTNNLFITVNTVFLTAVGLVLGLSHFNSWWVVAAVTAITLVVTPLNIIWRAAMQRYGHNSLDNFDYLREIEADLRRFVGPALDSSQIGIFTRYEKRSNRRRSTDLEVAIATFFVALYPAISAVVAVTVYGVTAHLIPPFSLG